MVEAAVFEEAPELHARHSECVVRAVLVSKVTVEVVDFPQAADVSRDDVDHLK
jgi:hypothetical protein